jgi:hypothetical protein
VLGEKKRIWSSLPVTDHYIGTVRPDQGTQVPRRTAMASAPSGRIELVDVSHRRKPYQQPHAHVAAMFSSQNG